MAKPTTIDEYMEAYSPEVQETLQQVRRTIHEAAPEATEAISYAIPTFKLADKNLVHFAAFSSHIGFYATPDGHDAFSKELSGYHVGKGSVQFPLDKPMPLSLISRIVKYRADEVTK